MFELFKPRPGAQELRGVKHSVRIAILFQIGGPGNRSFKAESDLTSPHVSWHFLCSAMGDVVFEGCSFRAHSPGVARPAEALWASRDPAQFDSDPETIERHRNGRGQEGIHKRVPLYKKMRAGISHYCCWSVYHSVFLFPLNIATQNTTREWKRGGQKVECSKCMTGSWL